ncbi:MAG: BatD family protein, partial [Flavobacteriales bacterium]
MRIKIQHLYFYIVLIFCFLGKSVIAQEVSFTTSVGAKVVGLTDNFEVSYTSNKQGKFIQPKFKNFKVVSAVSTGESNQISAINGKVSRTTTFSYKLYLQPKRIGTFTVEGAKIKVGKATYQSKPVKVKVVKESQVRQRPQSLIDQFLGGGGQQAQPVQITQEDMFVKLDVSNSQVFHNQPVVVNYNLYKAKYQCQIEGFEIPTYQDFLSDEIKLDQNKAPGKETINGIEYEVHTLKKIVLTPQKPGMLRVDPYKVQLRVHTGSFFGTSVVMESNPLEITVKELPKPIPAEFSNQVGKFEVAIVPFSTELEIDNPVTFKVVISGEGNLKQLGAPQINFPNSLEVYDPETASE